MMTMTTVMIMDNEEKNTLINLRKHIDFLVPLKLCQKLLLEEKSHYFH